MDKIKGNEKVSRIRQNIYHLNKERDATLWKLLEPAPMITGSFYEVFKTCSKPNCRCQKGHRHGPFAALNICIDGKQRLKMVRKADVAVVKKKALAYRTCQRGLARIRKLNKEIDCLLEKVKHIFLEDYQ